MDRRTFIAVAGATTAGAALAQQAEAKPSSPLAKIRRPTLPFDSAALSPVISERQLSVHFNSHHVGYFDRLVTALPSAGMTDLSVEEVIAQTRGKSEHAGIYNSAGQLYAHNLYWASLAPALPPTEERTAIQLQAARTDESLSPVLRRRVARDFGSVSGLTKAMAEAAGRHFSNGWVWLARRSGGELVVYSTPNAQTPLDQNERPLLTIDLWEHAYYLDYMSKRGEHVGLVLGSILNWRTASANYEA